MLLVLTDVTEAGWWRWVWAAPHQAPFVGAPVTSHQA